MGCQLKIENVWSQERWGQVQGSDRLLPEDHLRRGNIVTFNVCEDLGSSLWRQEGVSSLWNGTKASLMLVSNPAIKFTVYEMLKRQFARGRGVSGVKAFMLGCIATAVATLITYPIQLIQVRALRYSKKYFILTTLFQLGGQSSSWIIKGWNARDCREDCQAIRTCR